MLTSISYFSIGGKPLIFYLGILTLTSFLFTASIAILNRRGIHKIPFVWHPRLAKISLGLALIHAFFAIAAYL